MPNVAGFLFQWLISFKWVQKRKWGVFEDVRNRFSVTRTLLEKSLSVIAREKGKPSAWRERFLDSSWKQIGKHHWYNRNFSPLPAATSFARSSHLGLSQWWLNSHQKRSGCCNVVLFKGGASSCPTATAGAHLVTILTHSSKAAVRSDWTWKKIIWRTKVMERRKFGLFRLYVLVWVKAGGPGTTESWMGWNVVRHEV